MARKEAASKLTLKVITGVGADGKNLYKETGTIARACACAHGCGCARGRTRVRESAEARARSGDAHGYGCPDGLSPARQMM